MEIVTAYDAEGRQLFPPRSGGRDSVSLPPRTETPLAGSCLIHNHPDVRTFSGTDLRTAATRRVRTIVAILPNGYDLRLSVPNPDDWPIGELLDRNDLARALARRELGAPHLPQEIDAFHMAFAENQRLLFAEIGVIMSIDGPSQD